MELTSTYDTNQKDLNLAEILQGESSSKGSQNLQSITLYVYSTTFLVYISNSNLNNLARTKQGNPNSKKIIDRKKIRKA